MMLLMLGVGCPRVGYKTSVGNNISGQIATSDWPSGSSNSVQTNCLFCRDPSRTHNGCMLPEKEVESHDFSPYPPNICLRSPTIWSLNGLSPKIFLKSQSLRKIEPFWMVQLEILRTAGKPNINCLRRRKPRE